MSEHYSNDGGWKDKKKCQAIHKEPFINPELIRDHSDSPCIPKGKVPERQLPPPDGKIWWIDILSLK